MSAPLRPLRLIALVTSAIFAASVVGTGGCSHGTSSTVPHPVGTPSPKASGSPAASPSPTATANIYISMAYASEQPTVDPTYGEIDGYAVVSPPPTPPASPTPTPSPKPSPTPTETPGPSSIINVPCNMNVVFLNFDTVPLTASVLTPIPGSTPPAFPPHFNNPNGGPNPSPLLTPISYPGYVFSTGFVVARSNTGIPGQSLVYSTGAIDGAFLIGDATFYDNSPSMRTVVNITGCP